MRLTTLAAVLVVFLSCFPTFAEEGRRAAIVEIIKAQLDAFERDDAVSAFALASPAIQEQFGSSGRFLRMVANAYAPVYRPQNTTFLNLIARGDGRLIQRVLFTGPDRDQVMALYTMARQTDGTWRIAGCVLLDPMGQPA